MKQTAVEWLKEMLIDNRYLSTIPKHLFEEAEKMEKQQIIDAWIAIDNELQRLAAQKYYNETYKSE